MKKKIEISEGFDQEEQKERETFLKLSDEERFIRTWEFPKSCFKYNMKTGYYQKTIISP